MKIIKYIIHAQLIIFSLSIGTSCSHKQQQEQKEIALKMDQLELQLNTIESLTRDASINESTFRTAEKLELKKDTITQLYNKIKLQLKGPWYKGRDLPYEQILDCLISKGYDLSDFDNFIPNSTELYKRVILIMMDIPWNMEDADKIKNCVLTVLTFEPELYKNRNMTWTTSKYDLEIYESGIGKIIIRFLTKN